MPVPENTLQQNLNTVVHSTIANIPQPLAKATNFSQTPPLCNT